MNSRRIKLHEKLVEILGSGNVYFQPPESLRIKYPAVVYSLNSVISTYADDSVYLRQTSYEVTVIDKNPDSKIADKISLLPRCAFNRCFVSDNLYHYVFTLIY